MIVLRAKIRRGGLRTEKSWVVCNRKSKIIKTEGLLEWRTAAKDRLK